MEIDNNPNLQSLIDKLRLSNQAMDIRLMLKNDEIKSLKSQIKSKQEMLSLQFHAINQMEKPLLIDQSVLNHITALRNLLDNKKKDLYEQEAENFEYNGKPFIKGSKLQNKWLQNGEDAYSGIKEFAEGPIQDLFLQIKLAELKIEEVKVRIDESKELYEGLEKEAAEQQQVVNDFQVRYKASLEVLDLLSQENCKLLRTN